MGAFDDVPLIQVPIVPDVKLPKPPTPLERAIDKRVAKAANKWWLLGGLLLFANAGKRRRR